MATEVVGYCRLCGAACGVRVTVDNGTVVQVRGDPAHPVSRGYVCPKGRKMAGLASDPERLARPMLRTAQGALAPVGWATAIDDLAVRLDAIRERAGAYAIGSYSGTAADTGGRAFANRLMGAIGSPSKYTSTTVDSIAKVLVPTLMAGQGLAPALDLEGTALLFVIGENMVVSHGGFSYFPDPVRYLREIQRRGEVWVLDPRRTETARLASRHLCARSGTDFAVLAYLVREVLREGADAEYLRDHARRVDELRDAVERFDLPTTAELTGLLPDDLVALLAAVRRHGRLAIVTGTGVTMAATANVTEWMAYALQIVTGSFERPGGRWFNHGAAFSPSACPRRAPVRLEPGPRTRPDIPRFADQYPCAVMSAEIEQGHLQALLVIGGNPLVAFPQPARLAEAFGRLDVLAVWDIVPSATVARATHVFPSPAPLERADLITPVQVSAVFAQYAPAVVPSPGDARPMWWSLAKLAERMGLSLLPDGLDPDACSDEDVFASLAAQVPVPWETLRAAASPVVREREDRWVERTVLPEGRWDVAPPLLVERLGHATGRPAHDLVLGNRREVGHTNSTFAWGGGERSYVYVSPSDAARAGVHDGDTVEVTSPHGVLSAVARVDESLARGTLVVPHGFSEPNVDNLTATDVDLDPLTGMPTLIGVPVFVRPLAPA